MARSVDFQKVAEWRARFERFQRAGKSVAWFCRGEGVSVPSFYQWRKKLASQSASRSSRSAFRSAAGDERGAFAAVRLVGAASLIARLPGGTRLEIPVGDPRALTLVIEALMRADGERAGRTDAERAGGAAC